MSYKEEWDEIVKKKSDNDKLEKINNLLFMKLGGCQFSDKDYLTFALTNNNKRIDILKGNILSKLNTTLAYVTNCPFNNKRFNFTYMNPALTIINVDEEEVFDRILGLAQ